MDQLKVVFIVPSFNISTNISKLLGSLTEQKNKSWECIIIDDISTDDTWENLKKRTDNDDRF